MNIIVLFNVPSIGKQVTSDLRWFSNNKPLITDMEDEHIKNARCWLFRQLSSLKALGYNEPFKNGFNYTEWFAILGQEEKRRIAVAERKRQKEIEKLRLATLSGKAKKAKAAKLLSGIPSDEAIAEAKEILGLKTVKTARKKEIENSKNSYFRYCYGTDKCDVAFESYLD